MSARYEASDKGIYVRVDEEAAPRPGVASQSARHAVAGIQNSPSSKSAALYGEQQSTAGQGLWVRSKGAMLLFERWNGSKWVVVASLTNAGAFDATDVTISGSPISGASPIADQRMMGNISGGSAVPGAMTAAQVATFLSLGTLAGLSAVGSAQITDGTIVDGDINASAAIALSKLATIADQRILGNVSGGAAVPIALTQAQIATFLGLGNLATATTLPVTFGIACSDETTTLTTGNGKATFRLPHAMTLTAVRSSLTTVSSSGLVTVDVNEGGSTVLSTKLSIDQGEKTSTTAATAAVISDASLADDAEITIDIDAAGATAAGLKVWLIGTRAA